MNKHFALFLCLVFCGITPIFPQSEFFFKNAKKDRGKVRFEFVKNLTIIPITLNGVELSFLLDTGVEKTILFSLDPGDSMKLEEATSIKLMGLGQGESMEAFKSENNTMEIGDAISRNLSMYVIFNQEMNLSQLLGIPINGIIGFDFFKNFVVEVNYTREFIKFYDPSTYDKKCRKCGTMPLYFHNNKPYVMTDAVIAGEMVDLTLLIDSGASDALWLFASDEIQMPHNYFEDFLGLGLSGPIYGKRSKIDGFSMDKYHFEDIATAFPDSLAFTHFDEEIIKDGLIGSEVLKRFDLVIDYPHDRLLLKPNRFFDDPFYYEMSGLVIRYVGVQVVKDREYVAVGKWNSDPGANTQDQKLYQVKFRIIPQLEIVEVRPHSPAFDAGLKIGDVLIEVNGKKAYNYTLIELTQLFSSEAGKRIRIKINRLGTEMVKKFRLEKVL